MIPIDPSNPDLLEVFADNFAMAIMHNTELNRYNPFHSLPKELFTDLEEYFNESIRVLIYDLTIFLNIKFIPILKICKILRTNLKFLLNKF